MEILSTVLYALAGALMWRATKRWKRKDVRLVGAVLWPITVLAFAVVGLLLVPFLFLALVG
jgi:hypothetical protein